MRSAVIRARSNRDAHRLRRHVRRAVAGAALAGLALTGLAAVTPADAAPAPAPRVKLVPGDRAITAGWTKVGDATSYTVRISKKKSLAHAKTVTTTKRALRLGKLRNGTAYYVAVTANRPQLTASAVRSRVVKATAAKGVPFPVGPVSVASGPGIDQVTVSWTGGGRALKVAVVAGSAVLTDIRSFHSPWYPATTRSIVLTVPQQYRAYIGAGTGNPVWVKVVQSNSGSTAFGSFFSYERKYRTSPPGTWAFAGTAPQSDAAVSRLTVAELNTQSVGSTEQFSRTNQWAERAPRLADYINTASPKPDLLLTAELATNTLDDCANTMREPYRCRSHTQVADLARRLDDLTLADSDAYDRVLDRMRDAERWAGKVTNGAHILYNRANLTLLDHGYYAPAMSPSDDFANVEGLGVTPWDPSSAVGPDRWLTWAKFETTDGSARQFYAVAAHFPVGDQSVVVNARAEEVTKLIAAIQRRAGNLPIVFGGDLNSDATRSPRPVQPAFIRAGWFDAAAVAAKSRRTGMKVSTANGSGPQDTSDSGYGSKPVYHPYETSRIDYILLKNSPHTYSYANVLRLNANGTFRKDLQGTDHNMQLARIGIGDPAS